jgi:SNF2 family DNA or RNA helicase
MSLHGILDDLQPHDAPKRSQLTLTRTSNIRTPLKRFQTGSVHWMLEREGVALECDGRLRAFNDTVVEKQRRWVLDRKRGSVYTSDVMARMPIQPYGGLLAEEMGLGKTVRHPCTLVDWRSWKC